MPFYWSNQIYCNKCGGTNLWFVMRRSNDRKSGWKKEKICKECYNEHQRKRTKLGYWRTEKARARIKAYRDKNREKVRRWNRESKITVKIRKQRRI